MALTDKLTAIADAIRSKTGKTDGMTLDQMATEISGIKGGPSLDTCTVVVTTDVGTVCGSYTKVNSDGTTNIAYYPESLTVTLNDVCVDGGFFVNCLYTMSMLTQTNCTRIEFYGKYATFDLSESAGKTVNINIVTD